jgi:hypothetical protein
MDRRHQLFALISLAIGALAATSAARADFLPDNDLYLQDCASCESGLTQDEFNAVIAKAKSIYSPVISGLGGSLSVAARWSDSTVNASATQLFGIWQVNMYGGLARRAEVTPDAFTLVICHELGHHLAGFPYVSTWAANEGQADYFATKDCANLFWEGETAVNATFRSTVEATPKAACDELWSTEAAQDLCYRKSVAAKHLADLLGALPSTPTPVSFDTHDPAQVAATDNAHPKAQCRLDTMMAGATCLAGYDKDYIPGKRNGRGANDSAAETDSARFSCTASGNYDAGLRPRCWFKPTL